MHPTSTVHTLQPVQSRALDPLMSKAVGIDGIICTTQTMQQRTSRPVQNRALAPLMQQSLIYDGIISTTQTMQQTMKSLSSLLPLEP